MMKIVCSEDDDTVEYIILSISGIPAVEQLSRWTQVKAGLAAGSHPRPLSSHSEAGGPSVQGAKGRACGQGSHPVLPGGRGLPAAVLQLVPQQRATAHRLQGQPALPKLLFRLKP